MKYLTIDIETRAKKVEDLYDEDKEIYDKLSDEDKVEYEKKMALNPFTSELVCISIKRCNDLQHENGWVLIVSPYKIESTNPKYKYVCFETKKELYEKFWQFLTKQKEPYKFITFMGREFDFPYILLDSAIEGVPNSANLMQGSDWTMHSYHIDLAKELCFFKYSSKGAIQLRSLDYYCKRFLGKTSKKIDVKGSLITTLYNEGKIKEIADYASGGDGSKDSIGDTDITFELFCYLINIKFL